MRAEARKSCKKFSGDNNGTKLKRRFQLLIEPSIKTAHYISSIINYDHITKQSSLISHFPPLPVNRQSLQRSEGRKTLPSLLN